VTSGPLILLVEDDDVLRGRLARAFADRGLDVRQVTTFDDAKKAAEAEPPELVLLDLRIPGGQSLDLIPFFKELDAETRIVVLTGYGSIATVRTRTRSSRPLNAAATRRRSSISSRCRSIASNGSISIASSWSAGATCPKPPVPWAFTGVRCSANWRDTLRADEDAGQRRSVGVQLFELRGCVLWPRLTSLSHQTCVDTGPRESAWHARKERTTGSGAKVDRTAT
jgi:CheY-like chemotaxis protein